MKKSTQIFTTDNIVIQQVCKTKFLGVILNHSLSWNDFILFIEQQGDEKHWNNFANEI